MKLKRVVVDDGPAYNSRRVGGCALIVEVELGQGPCRDSRRPTTLSSPSPLGPLFSFLFSLLFPFSFSPAFALTLLLLCGQFFPFHPSKTHKPEAVVSLTGAGPPNTTIALSPPAPSSTPSSDILTPCAVDYIVWRSHSHSP
jgi:hypothetical protein